MTFLPIVERELRVASRKGWTFWVRVVSAGLAAFIASGFMLIAVAEAAATRDLGGPLFKTLSWISFAVALSVGLFFTSDCLSEEKREGTLGFLFLTDLRGYDVVLGKLLATSLRCVFGLLAVFPILAITQLMGGVEPVEFWQTLLALLHAMFFSLASGMFVSAVSRQGQKAMSGTLLLILAFIIGGPVIDRIMVAALDGKAFFALLSPGVVFLYAGRGAGIFWDALLPSQCVAWLMLGAACVFVPRTWQEKSGKTSTRAMHWRYWWKYGGKSDRAAFRQKMLTINPVTWLASRERWQRLLVLIVCGVVVLIYGAMLIASDSGPELWLIARYITQFSSLLLYLWIASQACQFFAEARRSGLLELLLATPLQSQDVIRGVWRAMLRLFALPVGLYIVVVILMPLVSMAFGERTWASVMGAKASEWFALLGTMFSVLVSAVITLGNLITLVWFGMWMSLVSKNSRMAMLKTLLFVQVIPWFAISFASALAMPLLVFPTLMSGNNGTSWIIWYPLVIGGISLVLVLGKDALFFFWARKKLMNEFREIAVRAIAPTRAPVLSPMTSVHPPIATPPVMSKP